MTGYNLEFTDRAKEDIAALKKSEPSAFRKIEKLLDELIIHPYTGIGKPKPLLQRPNLWSRRINKKHRLVYSINNNQITVLIVSAKGHYDDK
jgi:toxin YoeB